MNILMLSANDPAGMGIAFKNAINLFSDHLCRLITTEEKYGFGYKKDIHLPDCAPEDFDLIEKLLTDADIIHFHILADEHMRLGPFLVKDYIKGKQIVHHHHGHPHFRANPDFYCEKYKKLQRKVLVSTPDLLKLVPEATWVPNLVPINDPLLLPSEETSSERITIGQSPTRKKLKNTNELVEVITDLQTNNRLAKDIELKIVELMDHESCLREKKKCHIIFDHMQGYYGVSSLESLSQGKPVIVGLDDWNVKCIKKFTGANELPWLIARNEKELQNVLLRLLSGPELRLTSGKQARNFMEQYWTEQHVLQVLFDVYASL